MRILLLSRYSSPGATSRYRCYQFLPYLRDHDVEVVPCPLLGDEYLRALNSGTSIPVVNVAGGYLRRLAALMRRERFDLIWVQQEFFPWMPFTVERLLRSTRVPYAVDFDDAFFHRYDMHPLKSVRWLLGTKIDAVMRDAAVVVAGNPYLVARAETAGAKRIEILPTVVDLRRYQRKPRSESEAFVIGWIGSPGNARYLQSIAGALRALTEDPHTRLEFIGAGPPGTIDGVVATYKQWQENREAADLLGFDAGIMPLPDSPWEQGKCGLKLLQYMAAGLPVVGSPVGVNADIIEDGVNGFQAVTEADFIDRLSRLRKDPEMRYAMGAAGREKVVQEYSLDDAAPRLLQILHRAAGKSVQ